MAQGLDALKRKLAAMPAAAKKEIEKELDRSANDVAALARGLAPVEDGALKASIRVEPGKHDLARNIIAGDDKAFYARWVEHGHKDGGTVVNARPFFFPAWRALRRSIKTRLGRAYSKAAKSVASSGGENG